MAAVADRFSRPAGVSPTLLMTLLAALCHGNSHSALPPAAEDASGPKAASAPVTTLTESDSSQGFNWVMPVIRLGGTVSYSLRRDSSDERSSQQSGLTTTLRASANTFIWQPWFARINGGLGFTTSTVSSSGIEASNSSKSVAVTGSGQLTVLSQSKFPFEAHFQRNNSRASTDLAVANGYASQSFGFTQRYLRKEGDAMFGWDRNTQTSVDSGRDLQDSLQLQLSHRLEKHSFQFMVDRSTNAREITSETAMQSNFSLQHSYVPDSSISMENMGNISRSDYHLQLGDNRSRLLQLSSTGFWRSNEQPLSVNAGVRMYTLEADSAGFAAAGNVTGSRVLNANANLGVNYEFNRFTRLSASANVNMSENNGAKSTNTNETVGVAYQPDLIELGSFRYGWGTSASATNRTGGEDSDRQLNLQFSHNLSRRFSLDGGSIISVEASEGLALVASSRPTSGDTSTKQLTHSGSVSWDLSKQAGAANVRLSASDSRALDGLQEFFQLINFQASSSLPTGRDSSWTGNLTIQGVRQGKKIDDTQVSLDTPSSTQAEKGFVTSSGGSISYQNSRFFGVRRLNFISDLRLNSQSLLPLLGNAKDQEVAAWDNRLSYSIGRTQLQVSMQVSSTGAEKRSVDPVTKVENVASERKVSKSIMFSVSRNFGSM